MELEIYESYTNYEDYKVPRKEFFTDRSGYLNENAFQDFTNYISKAKDIPNYYLVCFNIDLRNANAKSTAWGDRVLYRFVSSLDAYFVFRIQGEKFNMLITKEQIPTVTELLKKPNEHYRIYFGIVRDKPYKPSSPAEEREMTRKGVALMYENKGEKAFDKGEIIMGSKGNTPKELRETKLKKFRSTMWYSIIHLTITEPIYKSVTIFVYPTELKEPLQALPIIVAVYDKVEYNVKYGSTVNFGINGIRFTVSSRFDREEHLNVSIFAMDKCKCDIKPTTVEGVCIPATFGKRIVGEKGFKELFPLNKNSTGMYDYILLDDGEIRLDTSGYITFDNGIKYGVSMDETCIDLIKIQ